jgi:SAM-dependent methyltransferase
MIERISRPTDYDNYAPTYAATRFAHSWLVGPLREIAARVPIGGAVLEIGCGTGNYIHGLAEHRPELSYFGFDLSEPMLHEARARGGQVIFSSGDAASNFPYPDEQFSLAFAVDVIHHIDDLDRFFAEAERVLVPAGILLIATDSEETLRRRSLTVFFPEILQVELSRYPTIAQLRTAATAAGLLCTREERVEGCIPLDPDYIAKLEAKCASSLRLITPEQHATGMGRVRAAAARGEQWLSCYDVLRYVRPPRAENRLAGG